MTTTTVNALIDALDLNARTRPDRVFLTVWMKGERHAFTFAHARAEALRFAASFESLNLPAGSVAFIILQHRPELYFSFLGAMYAGLTPSMLPFPTPKQDSDTYWGAHTELFKRVEPGVILTYAANIGPLEASLGTLNTEVLDIDALPNAATARRDSAPALKVTALLQHSSGTTGLKKGVQLTFGQIKDQAASYAQAINMTDSDVVVSWLPLYHDMGLLSSFLIPLSVGASIVSLDPFEWVGRPLMVFDAIREHRGTLIWQPNFAFNHMARLADLAGDIDVSTMRAFISCSEPCKVDTFDRFLAAFGRFGVRAEQLQTCYAMAETVFAVSQSVFSEPPRPISVAGAALDLDGSLKFVEAGEAGARQFLSNGTPIGGLEVSISTEATREIWAPDASSLVTGEIVIRGDFVTDGYFRNPEANADAFDEGSYRTGDIGFFHQGELFICGRRKELLIVHGRNYYATDIEEVVNGVEGVKQGRAVAFSVFNDRTQSEEGVVVVESERPVDGHTALKRKVKQAVFDNFELTLQSVEIVSVGWLHKTTSGKISRKENAAKYLRGIGRSLA